MKQVPEGRTVMFGQVDELAHSLSRYHFYQFHCIHVHCAFNSLIPFFFNECCGYPKLLENAHAHMFQRPRRQCFGVLGGFSHSQMLKRPQHVRTEATDRVGLIKGMDDFGDAMLPGMMEIWRRYSGYG